MLESLDPSTIEDGTLRQVFINLMNVVETQQAKLAEQAAEIQQLRDEISRLKGEQGKPKIRGNTPSPDLSSEKERRQSKPHHKSRKQVHIDREVKVKLDRAQLPADAEFKGHVEVIVQDISIGTDNIRFRREKYYSPSQQRTYLAPLPVGYTGQFGPEVKAWVLALYHGGQMSEPKILEVLQTIGMEISAGQLSDLLIKKQEPFHAESAAILRAGLKSSPWPGLWSLPALRG